MGWFTESKVELISTGKVIAEPKVTGTRWTELAKFVGIIAAMWVFGSGVVSVDFNGKDSVTPKPGATRTAPAKAPDRSPSAGPSAKPTG